MEARLLVEWEWAWPVIRLAGESRRKKNELSYGANLNMSGLNMSGLCPNRVDIFINFG